MTTRADDVEQHIFKLKQNDPELKFVGQTYGGQETRFLEALTGNTHVEDIRLHGRLANDDEVNQQLLETGFLQTSRSLTQIWFCGWTNSKILERTLKELSKAKENVQIVELRGCYLDKNCLSSLAKCRSIRSLSIILVQTFSIDTAVLAQTLREMVFLKILHLRTLGRNNADYSAVVNCFSEQHTLQTLKLINGNSSLGQTLRGAANLKMLQSIVYTCGGHYQHSSIIEERCNDIREFLISTNSTNLKFELRDFPSEYKYFKTIIDGLQKGNCVKELSLFSYHFSMLLDNESMDGFLNLFVDGFSVSSLHVQGTHGSFESTTNLLIRLLNKTGSGLKDLSIASPHGDWKVVDFELLLSAIVEGSSLESLKVNQPNHESDLLFLVDRITDVQLCKRLEIWFDCELSESVASALLQKLGKNWSLEEFQLHGHGPSRILEYQEFQENKIQAFIDRNKMMKRLLAVPIDDRCDKWPELLEQAFDCDRWLDIVWRVLRYDPTFFFQTVDGSMPSSMDDPSPQRKRMSF